MNERNRAMSVCVYGIDTETMRGKPISFQAWGEDVKHIEFVNERNITFKLLSFLDSICTKKHVTYVLYGHNLKFDLVELLYPHLHSLKDEEFSIESGGWLLSGVYGNTTFAIFRHQKKNKTVYVVDTGQFFRGSLASLSEIFCPDLRKLDPPKRLGSYQYGPENKAFVRYALRDAEIAYHVGLFIDALHEEFDIKQTFSVAHFAAQVFRHHFMEQDLPSPSTSMKYAAMYSYHGGKNLMTVESGLYHKVYMLDIISAYPFAMYNFPSFYDADLYRGYKIYGHVSGVPPYGIYKLSGVTRKCDYPVIFDHGFNPVYGSFKDIWITGFEINEALRAKELSINRAFGYFYKYEYDNNHSPFTAFVKYFFDKKDSEPNEIKKYFYKIVLNSLYGKFIETRKDKLSKFSFDLDTCVLVDRVVIKGGTMFHPFVASLITGHTRAYIHRLEHKYKAMHTSTDGIITQIKPKEKFGLGGYKIEAHGKLLLLRNKLYVLWDKGEIKKKALHGFRGTPQQLIELWESGARSYKFTHVNKLKESLRRNLQVNDFVERTGKLNI